MPKASVNNRFTPSKEKSSHPVYQPPLLQELAGNDMTLPPRKRFTPQETAQLKRILDSNIKKAYPYLLKALPTEADAHDVFQACFARIAQRVRLVGPLFPNVRGKKKLRLEMGYFWKALKNGVRKFYRDHSRRSMSSWEDDALNLQASTSLEGVASAVHELDASSPLYKVCQSVLSDRQIEILFLRFIDECSVAEIASKLGIEAASVSNSLSISRRRLREALTGVTLGK